MYYCIANYDIHYLYYLLLLNAQYLFVKKITSYLIILYRIGVKLTNQALSAFNFKDAHMSQLFGMFSIAELALDKFICCIGLSLQTVVGDKLSIFDNL